MYVCMHVYISLFCLFVCLFVACLLAWWVFITDCWNEQYKMYAKLKTFRSSILRLHSLFVCLFVWPAFITDWNEQYLLKIENFWQFISFWDKMYLFIYLYIYFKICNCITLLFLFYYIFILLFLLLLVISFFISNFTADCWNEQFKTLKTENY